MVTSLVGFFRSVCLRSPTTGRKRNHRRGPAGSRNSGASGTGIETLEPRHTFSVTPVGLDAVPGNTSSLYSIAIGGSQAHAVNFLGDHDWYRVTLTAGTRYQFNLNATNNAPSVPAMNDPFLRLRNGWGAELASDDDSGGGTDSRIIFTATSSGMYFLDAGAFSNACTGGYTLTTAALGTDDYASSTSTLGSVAVGGAVTGVINSSGDHDWFRVYLTAGRSYRFDLTRGSLADPYLGLRDSAGTLLADDDDSGGNNNSRINYRPSTSGWFYLDASGYGSRTGSYTLRVTRTA